MKLEEPREGRLSNKVPFKRNGEDPLAQKTSGHSQITNNHE
jgi:hypothetical protein